MENVLVVTKKKLKYYIVAAFILFACLMIFYTVAHPLYIYDVDDWLYVVNNRSAFPSISQWNPTKVLPETIFPLISFLGAYFIYPILGDYILSLMLAYAFFVSVCITLYFGITAVTLKHIVWGGQNGDKVILLFIMPLFILVHYFAYFTQDTNNYYVFYSGNVNCYFNYIIPALWNFVLCCLMEIDDKNDKFLSQEKIIKKGLMILIIYLAINSNLWHSIILMAYMGVELLENLVYTVKEKMKWRIFLKDNLLYLISLLMWFISMIYEVNGGRAKWSSESTLQIKESLKAFLLSITQIRRELIVAVILINIIAFILMLRKNNPETRSLLLRQCKNIAILILTIVYLILLASKVGADYMKNPSVMISWMLWILFMSAVSLTFVLKFVPRVAWMIPLCIYVLVFEVVVSKKTFAQSYASRQVPSVIKALDDDIIQQVKAAEDSGETSVTVYIPQKGSGGWPISPYMLSTRVSNALYYHGVTQTKMDISIVPSELKDEEFHLK